MLQLDGVVRSFGDRVAADRVSFTVPDAAITGFVGGNGAGKTTTMRIVMGVLGLDAGEVRWDGEAPTRALRRRFGYLPEERGLYPKQPVLAQLEYLGRLRGLGRAGARRSATALLGHFALADRQDAKLESLSLGNQQRVQIVAALMGDPVLLVLDEPFSGLDPLAVDDMTSLLRELAGRGVAVLFSSHQLELVERLCDRLVILAEGRVVAEGTSDELRRRGRVRHRLVTGEPAGWVAAVPGVRLVADDGPAGVVVELDGPETGDRLVRAALDRGSVRGFTELVPTVADVFRKVTA